MPRVFHGDSLLYSAVKEVKEVFSKSVFLDTSLPIVLRLNLFFHSALQCLKIGSWIVWLPTSFFASIRIYRFVLRHNATIFVRIRRNF